MSTYGNLKYNFTFPASNPSGSLVLIKSITASASASVSFVNGSSGVVLDSTYKAYKFVFKNIHPATNNEIFTFQGSTNGGSSYGVTITSTAFRAYHNEADTSANLDYVASWDLAQSTNYQYLAEGIRTSDPDGSASGELWLFNPSSTTYVKHFMSNVNYMQAGSETIVLKIAGYFNTTSSINAIDFKMSSGNIDDGAISLYGLA
jgi:hypothetical protein